VEKRLISMSSITSKFLSFFHWMVFDLFFIAWEWKRSIGAAKAFSHLQLLLLLYDWLLERVLRCDWLPERARWSSLAHSGLPVVSCNKYFPESHAINPLLTKLVRSRWLDIGLARSFCFASLWTSTPSRSINR